MLPSPVLIVGDVHLGVATPEAEIALLRLLREVPARARALVIMGDLFDFWFAWKHAMPRTGYRVLAALAELTDAGIPVLWIGGNHDCWGGEALQELTGAHYTLDPWKGELGGWRAQLDHGDGLREIEDRPYRRLRTVLRHPLAIRLFSMLHPNLASWLALGSSHTSRNRRAGDEGRGLLAVATTRLEAADAPELVIFGHSHVPMLCSAGHGVYGNAGAWYLDRQYLLVSETYVARMQWNDDSAEGHLLNMIERGAKKPLAEREETFGRV